MAAPLLETVGPYAAGKGRKAARDLGRARIPTGNRRYQGVIVAEFLVAVLIVALAPIATGKQAEHQTGGPSPYAPDDIKQFAGVGAVYFILALLSSGKYGRLSAWLGGLILVAIGLAQTQSGGLAGIFGIFQPSSKSAGTGETGGVGSPFTPGIGQQIQKQAQQQFSQVPNATGSFPTIGPKLGFVDPGIPEQIQGQVEQQFNTGQTAIITQDQSTGSFQVA